MPEGGRPPGERLHLPDLSITGFRGIRKLAIPRLGRVTLLAGMNGVGKTAVLEACRIYAKRGQYSAMSEIARKHDEYVSATEEDGDRRTAPNPVALFYGREKTANAFIEIGRLQGDAVDRLKIYIDSPSAKDTSMMRRLFPMDVEATELRVLVAEFRGRKMTISDPFSSPDGRTAASGVFVWPRQRRTLEGEPFPTMTCMSLGPDPVRNDWLTAFWDRVALTEDEVRARRALGLVLGDEVEGVAMVGADGTPAGDGGRRAMVKLAGGDRRVPLKVLGDGSVRLFGVALALAVCRGGMLLIDEAENGIHHTVQEGFWRMILRTARANDVQVLATTHGWDCVRGFARAAVEDDDVEGVLVRLEKEEGGGVRAVEYSESDLATAAAQGIEVR